jgi:hypothetical protein
MDNPEYHSEVPTGWLETLAESEAELAAGQTVPGEVVHQRLLDSIARIEAMQAAARPRQCYLAVLEPIAESWQKQRPRRP